jgi:hypothetical protein
MRTLAPWTKFQHHMRKLREDFWGDLYKQTRAAWERFLDEFSLQERDRYLGLAAYERAAAPVDGCPGLEAAPDAVSAGLPSMLFGP